MRHSIYLTKHKLLTYNPTAPELIEHEFIAGDFKESKTGRRFDAFHIPFSPKEIIYKGNKINVPENVEKHLIENYGDDWKTPAEVWHSYKMQLNLKATTLAGKVYPTWARDTFYMDKSNHTGQLNIDGKVNSLILSKRKKEELK